MIQDHTSRWYFLHRPAYSNMSKTSYSSMSKIRLFNFFKPESLTNFQTFFEIINETFKQFSTKKTLKIMIQDRTSRWYFECSPVSSNMIKISYQSILKTIVFSFSKAEKFIDLSRKIIQFCIFEKPKTITFEIDRQLDFSILL